MMMTTTSSSTRVKPFSPLARRFSAFCTLFILDSSLQFSGEWLQPHVPHNRHFQPVLPPRNTYWNRNQSPVAERPSADFRHLALPLWATPQSCELMAPTVRRSATVVKPRNPIFAPHLSINSFNSCKRWYYRIFTLFHQLMHYRSRTPLFRTHTPVATPVVTRSAPRPQNVNAVYVYENTKTNP